MLDGHVYEVTGKMIIKTGDERIRGMMVGCIVAGKR
jgi:hypothetical protein